MAEQGAHQQKVAVRAARSRTAVTALALLNALLAGLFLRLALGWFVLYNLCVTITKEASTQQALFPDFTIARCALSGPAHYEPTSALYGAEPSDVRIDMAAPSSTWHGSVFDNATGTHCLRVDPSDAGCASGYRRGEDCTQGSWRGAKPGAPSVSDAVGPQCAMYEKFFRLGTEGSDGWNAGFAVKFVPIALHPNGRIPLILTQCVGAAMMAYALLHVAQVMRAQRRAVYGSLGYYLARRRLEKQRSCCGYHNTVISYTLLAFTLGLTIMVFAWREGCPSHLSPSR